MPKTVAKNKKEKSKPANKNGIKKVKRKEQDSILRLKKENQILEDRYLRLKAEFDNFRKRKSEEISKLLLYDGEKVIKGFLPVIDDLERMLIAAKTIKEDVDESLLDGLNMVNSKIEKYFETLEVIPYGEKGEILDPDLHDAMMTRNDQKQDENVILEVFEKGYTYREKVIRHAKVIVNKK